jgi:hypothetical protein
MNLLPSCANGIERSGKGKSVLPFQKLLAGIFLLEQSIVYFMALLQTFYWGVMRNYKSAANVSLP